MSTNKFLKYVGVGLVLFGVWYLFFRKKEYPLYTDQGVALLNPDGTVALDPVTQEPSYS